MTLEELKVIITAETSGLKKELNSLQSQVNNTQKSVDKSTKKISSGFSKLTKAVSLTAITVGLYKFSKSAIEAASDLQEVQNVVDVAFGDMSDEVDEFAKNASAKFGLSEKQAKEFASTFMAMSNGMGIAAETGKAMSLTLTQLAGDMASFYNVSQDVADTALNSVFTGETETLKKFGVVMTEANLSAYAMSKGITKAYSDMTQAEKVILRYSFVLNTTKNAQGDYARTCNNWANQVRLLKNQFTDLLAVLGSAFIKVLTPVIQMINLLVSKLITLANVIAEAFGGTGIEEIKNSTSSGADSTSDMASNLSDSNDEAKQLKKTLAGFDELNVLSKDDSSSTSSTGVDSSIAALANETYEPPKIDTKQFEGQFKSISDIFSKWFDNIPKLELNFNTKKAIEDLKNFGASIVNVIAGWGSFIIEIGIKVANDLNIGKLLNNVISLVKAIGSLASALTDILVPVLSNLYDTFLSPIVKLLGEITSLLLQTLTSAIQSVANFLTSHAEGITTALTILTTAAGSAFTALMLFKGITAIPELFNTAKNVVNAFTMGLQGMQGAMVAGESTMSAFSAGTNLATGAQTALKTALSAITSPIGIVVAAVALLTAGFVYLWETNEGFRKEVTNLWNNVLKPIFTELGSKFKSLWNDTLKPFWETNLKPLVESIGNEASELMTHLKALWTLILEPTLEAIIKVIGTVVVTAIDLISSAIEVIIDVIENVVTVIQGVIDFIEGVFTGDWEQAWTGIKEIFEGIFGGIFDIVVDVVDGIVSAIDTAINSIKNLFGLVDKESSKTRTLNFNSSSKSASTSFRVPKMASGGVLTAPTFALLGEYAGANSNPEIVTPQSLLKETINASNANVVNAIYSIGNQISKTVNEKNTDIYMDTAKVTRRITKEQNNQNKLMGTSLVMV